MRSSVPFIVALIVASGCVEAPPEGSAAATDLLIDEDRPAPEFGKVVTGPAVGPDVNATTAAVPRLVVGEWWRIQYDDPIGGPDIEFVRVVANETEDGYIFGMPHEGWYKEAIAYHAPAFGDVAQNLSYKTHNVWFEPLHFPLKAGDKWRTHFAAAPIDATVLEADKFTAVIEYTFPQSNDPMALVFERLGPGGGSIKATYDARMHEIVKMESFIGTWQVVEHGYDFEGWVTVPRGEHTAIDYGTFGPAAPDEPLLTRKIKVDGGFNRLTMMHAIFAFGPGQFRIKSDPPEGPVFTTESTGVAPSMIRFYEAMDPDGEWIQEDWAMGPGATYSMGIAYHQYDISLPDGLRRSDHHHPVIR